MRRTSNTSEHSELVARRLAQLTAEIERTQVRPLGVDIQASGPLAVTDPDSADQMIAGLGDDLRPMAATAAGTHAVTVIKPAGRHSRRRARDRDPAALDRWHRLADRLRGPQLRPGPLGALLVAVLVLAAIVGLRLNGQQTQVLEQPVVADSQPLLTSGEPHNATDSAGEQPSMVVGSEPDRPAAPGAQPVATHPGEVVVDVAGKVRRPGIVVLPSGSRVVDAIKAAGGARKGVDLTPLNLARPLTDGEQILVGVETVDHSGMTSSAAAGASPLGGALINLNQADQVALETLPGVGPVTAQAILAWRAANGVFTSVSELLEVDGIGDATLAKISPHVTV